MTDIGITRRPTTTPPGSARDPLADGEGGWTVQRRKVVDDACGICVRCGMAGADTATRSWVDEALVAAHTRCVVGLGPPAEGHRSAA